MPLPLFPDPCWELGCRSQAQGRTHSRLLAAGGTWVGFKQNTESLFQIVKRSWETQSNQSRIQKQFFVINNCKPGFLVQRGTNSQLLIKTNTSTLGQKADLMGRPQPCLQRPFRSTSTCGPLVSALERLLAGKQPRPSLLAGQSQTRPFSHWWVWGRPFPRECWAH